MPSKNNRGGSQQHCVICGRGEHEVTFALQGLNGIICADCVKLASDYIRQMEGEDSAVPKDVKLSKAPKPAEIKARLDEYVIGQERAKKVLSVAVYNHPLLTQM